MKHWGGGMSCRRAAAAGGGGNTPPATGWEPGAVEEMKCKDKDCGRWHFHALTITLLLLKTLL